MMAVQAQQYSFPHEPRAIRPALENAAANGSAFLDEPAATALLQQQLLLAAVSGGGDPRSELTCSQHRRHNSNLVDDCCFVPRNRARVAGDDGEGVAAACLLSSSVMHGGGRHRALLPPPVPQVFGLGDVQKSSTSSSRVVGSGAASTSGRPAAVSQHGLLLSHLYRQSVEVDALVRFENERLRAGLEEARRRHLRAVVSAVERSAARRLHAAEAELERALGRNAELDERLRQMGAEGQAWLGIARSHEAATAGLRATLDQLLQQSQPCAAAAAAAAADGEGGGDAEDAQSCCFVAQAAADVGAAEVSGGGGRKRACCRACGETDACVLLLPCRHLCLCGGCEAAADACPVCAATKNASLHVLLQ